MMPVVTLVTPVYNAMPYFKEYLNSVLEQTWRPLEFICVDDGSTDDSLTYLESMVPVFKESGIELKIIPGKHKGQASAFNEALPLVTGEYFTWCDSDDLLTKESIENKVKFLHEHPEYAMVRSNGKVIDGDTGEFLFESAREDEKFSKDIFEDLFRDITYCYAGCYLMKASLLFECYPDKKLPVSSEGQNLQLLLPPASRTECGYLDEQLHIYCRRKSGHSSKKRSFTETMERVRNFTKLRMEIIPFCTCDKVHYEKMAKEIELKYKRQLLASAAKQAREEIGR